MEMALGNNPEFEKIGKAAIAATLLPLEREPELIIKWRKLRLKHEKPKLGGHWYQYLAGLLLTNTSFDDFDKNNLSIITFNYDRSLEHYLFTKLKASFRKKTVEECAEKVSAIEIIHMYGQLGYLPWQKFDKHKIVYDMGPVDESQRISTINNAMYSIKTIGENIDENENHIKRARQLLKEATNIYVLGFGYHPFNLKILDLAHLEKGINIRGTSRGLSFQRKIELGRLDILNLKYDPERNNPRYLYDEDVYDFLYQQAILE